MAISGVAILAICALLGAFLGDALGSVLGVKANVGGVGIAMVLLMICRLVLVKRGALSHGLKTGVEFWAAMYIPIVIAMAAQQNVLAAVEGGPMVVIAGVGTVLACFAGVAIMGRMGGPVETMDEIEARDSQAREADRVLSGDPG